MQLLKCKSCKHFVSMINSSVVCSHDNLMNERQISNIEDGKIVNNCPISDTTTFEAKKILGEKITCQICSGKGTLSENNQPCPFCKKTGSLSETSGSKEIKIPHLSEFRIKAVRVGEKYKVVMTTDNNNELVSQSAELDLNNDLFNQIFFQSKKLLAQE